MEEPMFVNNGQELNKNSKSKKLVVSIAILILVGIAAYYFVAMFKTKQLEDARAKRISESAAWLDTQNEQMTQAQKEALGKSLEKQAKQYKTTPDEQKETLDFLNS
jgi:uncharacterized protein HemX